MALLLACTQGWAQSGKFFTVDNELSSSLVQDVYQDHHGFIWIATVDGLLRYDASKFITYKNDGRLPGGVLSNFSHVIFEDRHHQLYIGYGNGLQSYDLASNSFREIPLRLENGNPAHAYVTCMLERRNGDILISTSGYGIFQLDAGPEPGEAVHLTNLIPSSYVTCIFEDVENNLWATSQDSGLYCLNDRHEVINFFNDKAKPNASISCFGESRSGVLYAGSSNRGLFRYDRSTRDFVPLPSKQESPLSINTIVQRKDGELLIGTEGMGLKVLNPENETLTDGNFSVASVDFSRSKVTSILEDRSGNLWLGLSQKGVVLLPATSSNFEYIGHKSLQNNIIGSASVTSLHMDHLHHLWVGTDGDGLYELDEKGGFLSHYVQTTANPDFPATIMAIFEDSDRNFWLGTYDKGLVEMDRTTGICRSRNDCLDPGRGEPTPVFTITEDGNRNLWVGTLGSGLHRIHLATDETTHFHPSSDTIDPRSDHLNNRWINALLVSSREKLYIGTVVGLGCLDLGLQSFLSEFGENRILANQAIQTMMEDKDGTLWIGSMQGLHRLDPHSKEIKSYTTRDGLPGNVVGAIAKDHSDHLWISTNYGIARMHKDSARFINYYSFDGLQGNEFIARSSLVDQTGHVYFGGINGITHFNPLAINDEGRKLDLYFTGFYIHDREVTLGMKSGRYDILDSAAILATSLDLSHEDNSFAMEFSAMEFANPERIIYMYKLDPDTEWITLRPGTNSLTFSNLSPGEYRFRIRAQYFSTFSDERAININIHPAWYVSVWAKASYALILSLILLWGFHLMRQRQRTRLRMQMHVQAKQLDEAKLQSFINIAHEIRTPITLIINPLKKLRHTDQDQDHQKSYARIQRNAERILHLVNQLMDIQKIDKNQMRLDFREIDLVEYLRNQCSAFEEQARSKQIELTFLPRVERLNVWIDPENFDKVLANLLSNALKFTPENGRIQIEVLVGPDPDSPEDPEDCFRIEVSDNGIGISEKRNGRKSFIASTRPRRENTQKKEDGHRPPSHQVHRGIAPGQDPGQGQSGRTRSPVRPVSAPRQPTPFPGKEPRQCSAPSVRGDHSDESEDKKNIPDPAGGR
ncbi:MAG: two-component regulator propeller domain-containing protein [Bacteroidales bacterium]